MKIEKSQNLHLFHSNLILCHLYNCYGNKLMFTVTKKSFFLFIKVLDSYRFNFSCPNFASTICSLCALFCFTFCFISIYSFNNVSLTNKKAPSIQSTLWTHFSKPRGLIFYTSPVSFAGLKTASV